MESQQCSELPLNVSDNVPMDSCCRVNNASNILETIRRLYIQRVMCDIRLIVGNKEYLAHRVILCASSDVFQAMLATPEWTEWKETSITLQELPECEKVFEEFLEYFYTGCISIYPINALPILALADKYLVKELSTVCVNFMCCQIPHAASHNQLWLWLQYASNCWHNVLANKCLNYIKWNLQAIANTSDFANFDCDILASILEQSDIVVYSELVLFNCIGRWLSLQNDRCTADDFKELLEKVMSHIRFPMMSTTDLAGLLISPLVTNHRDFFFERLRISMLFHRGHQTELRKFITAPNQQLMFTPRLYNADMYSAELVIENFNNLPSYHTSTFVFSSHISMSDHQMHNVSEWIVELYPKGVWFKKCLLIVWQGTLQVPEEILSTVRLSLACRELPESVVKVKISILIYGIQSGIEHIVDVKQKTHHFDAIDKIVNIDNIIPFRELNPLATEMTTSDSRYLVGPNRDQLKLNIVITPITTF